jgi:hypothetical protein
MGKNIWGVPTIVSMALTGYGKAIPLTVGIVWTPVPTACVFVGHLSTVRQHVGRTLWPGKLVVATTKDAIGLCYLPLLETPNGQVLPKKNIKSGVDMLERIISNEDNCIEAFNNHRYLRSRVPSIVTSCREVRSFEAVTSPSTHGF